MQSNNKKFVDNSFLKFTFVSGILIGMILGLLIGVEAKSRQVAGIVKTDCFKTLEVLVKKKDGSMEWVGTDVKCSDLDL